MASPFFSSQAKKREQIVAIYLGSKKTKAVFLQRKSDRQGSIFFATLVIGLVSGVFSVRGAAPAPAPAKPALTNAPVEIAKSMFVDDFKIGKDPFYPASTRRNPAPPPPTKDSPKVPGAVVEPPPPPPPPPLPSKFISLKGLLGGSRPLAMVSTSVKSYELEPGEQLSVKVPDETKLPESRVKIKCVEIKAESIVLEIEGEPGRHEIRLPRRI